MYFQDEPGIYVYGFKELYYSEHLDYYFPRYKLTCIGRYNSLNDFFQNGSWNIRDIHTHFGYSIHDRICRAVVATHKWHTVYCNKLNCTEHDDVPYHNVMVVRDQDGKLYTPDRIVGEYRAWRKKRNKNRWWPTWHRTAWGNFRAIRTHQERKMADAWNDEEFAPKVRGRRSKANIPTSWDDSRRHAEKCWKRQSKRHHQWKPKKNS